MGAISKFINSYPTTCLDIKQQNNLYLSGYYIIRAPNGSLISIYCDMTVVTVMIQEVG